MICTERKIAMTSKWKEILPAKEKKIHSRGRLCSIEFNVEPQVNVGLYKSCRGHGVCSQQLNSQTGCFFIILVN